MTNYPADPTKVPRYDVATHFTILLEEMGFPRVEPDDRARLKTLLNDFIYAQPKEATQ